MYHFPASSSAYRAKSDSHTHTQSSQLNATQSKSASNPLFLKIEEELHDARRVREHGQEDDLRLALDMVIGRVSELTNNLSEAYKAQAELELQLNLARSNLQVIQMNNEMLEEALKKNNAAARDLGWRRSGKSSVDGSSSTGNLSNLERSQSMDYPYPESPASASGESRFFKFRFAGSGQKDNHSSSTAASTPTKTSGSRPGTPAPSAAAHLTSPSMPSLSSAGDPDRSDELLKELEDKRKELEDKKKELEKEQEGRKKALEDKAALEDELESLSQALFEEANKMVAQERMKLAETVDELNETRAEKEALQSALRLLNEQQRSQEQVQQHSHLRTSSSEFSLVDHESSPGSSAGPSRTHSRSSSNVDMKSGPPSPTSSLPPLPPSPFPDASSSSRPSSRIWTHPPRKESFLRGDGELASSPTSTIMRRLSGSSTLTYTKPGSLSMADGYQQGEAEESEATPRYNPPSENLPGPSSSNTGFGLLEESPWADVPSSNPASNRASVVNSPDIDGSKELGRVGETAKEQSRTVFDSGVMAAAYAGLR